MLSKQQMKAIKAGTAMQRGESDPTHGKTYPGIHGETENPPMEVLSESTGVPLGKGAHGFRVHKK